MAWDSGKLTLVPLRIVDTCSQDHFVLRSNSGWQLQLPTTVKADWLIDLLIPILFL